MSNPVTKALKIIASPFVALWQTIQFIIDEDRRTK